MLRTQSWRTDGTPVRHLVFGEDEQEEILILSCSKENHKWWDRQHDQQRRQLCFKVFILQLQWCSLLYVEAI